LYKYDDSEEGQKRKFSWKSKNENCAREKNSGKVVRLSDNLVRTGTGSVTFAHFSEEFLHFLARHLAIKDGGVLKILIDSNRIYICWSKASEKFV
jgi:hypothetical protein